MLYNVMELITDFTYYQDYNNMSKAVNVTVTSIKDLVVKYAKDDNVKDMKYLIDRDHDNKEHYCNTCIKYGAYDCIRMLCKLGYSKHIFDLVLMTENRVMFDFLTVNGLVYYNPTSLLNNSLLDKVVELYSKGILKDQSIWYKLEELGRYDLISKITHLYYKDVDSY